jgi:signal transduction histidine kinase
MFLLSGLLLIVVTAAFFLVNKAQLGTEEALNAALATTDAYAELEKSFRELRHQLAFYAATGLESHRDQASVQRKHAKDYLVQIERLEFTDEGKWMVGKLQRFSDIVSVHMENMNPEQLVSTRQAHAQKLVSDVLDAELIPTIHQQFEDKRAALLQAQLHHQTFLSRASWLLISLGGLGAVGGILAGIGLSRRFQQEVMELSVPIRDASGALDSVVGPIKITSTRGLADLDASLQELAHQVTTVVARLQKAEKENIRKQQMAAMGQLAAGLAHELRNPLTALQTLIQAAQTQYPQTNLDARDLQVMDEELNRLNSTLQNFLDFARPPRLKTGKLDLNEIAKKVHQLLSARAQQLSIQLVFHLSDQPTEVQGDPEQLQQVLLNLVINAFESIGTQGMIDVEISNKPDSSLAMIRVCDTGQGIAPEMKERLFEPYVSTKSTGTGLGLAISRRIVEEHGGTITGENQATQGACFTVTLPM